MARPALIGAVVLAAGRALGETMAVLMVAGNVIQLPNSLLAPVRTLTANIALELGYALDLHRSAVKNHLGRRRCTKLAEWLS